MRYLILIYGKESDWADISPERAGEIMGAYHAYTAKLKAAGVHIAGEELRPVADAKSIRGAGGATVVDGPFVDTKEQLGGFYMIEAPNDAEALKWAKQCPSTLHGGGMELRAVMVR